MTSLTFVAHPYSVVWWKFNGSDYPYASRLFVDFYCLTNSPDRFHRACAAPSFRLPRAPRAAWRIKVVHERCTIGFKGENLVFDQTDRHGGRQIAEAWCERVRLCQFDGGTRAVVEKYLWLIKINWKGKPTPLKRRNKEEINKNCNNKEKTNKNNNPPKKNQNSSNNNTQTKTQT